jgi:hypothetical protein
MKVFLAYVAPLPFVLLFLANLAAQVAVDAHHWMPRRWWPRSLFEK